MEFITSLQDQLVALAQHTVKHADGEVQAASLRAMEQAVQGMLQGMLQEAALQQRSQTLSEQLDQRRTGPRPPRFSPRF